MEKHLPCLDAPEAKADLQEVTRCVIRAMQRPGHRTGISVEGWNLLFEWCCKAGLRENALQLLAICSWRTDRVACLLPMVEWDELKNACGDETLKSVRLLEQLKSAGRDGDAAELARLMVSQVNTLDTETLEGLVTFCLSERGMLESELLEIVKKAPLPCLTRAVHLGGEECRKVLNDRVETMDASAQAAALAELVLKLDAVGARDAAVELAGKLRYSVLPGVAVTELKADLSLFFLFPFLDRGRVKALLSREFSVDEGKTKSIVSEMTSRMASMKNAAGLLGLKADEEATGAFAEFCSFVLELTGVETGVPFGREYEDAAFIMLERWAADDYERGEETPCMEFDDAKDLIEVVLWLGDDSLNDRIVCLLNEKTHLAWKLLRKESGFVPRVMAMGDSARRSLKRLAEGRVRHLMSGLEYGMEKIDCEEYGRRVCGMLARSVAKKPRLLRALQTFREKQWESRAAAEVCELEFLLSFSC